VGNGQNKGKIKFPQAGRHHRQVLHNGGGTIAERTSSLKAAPKLMLKNRAS